MKVGDKRDFLFCNLTLDKKERIQIDEVGLYSTTAHHIAADMAAEILQRSGSTAIIDATAGCGGNTIEFAKVFDDTVAIEKDVSRYRMLLNNIEVAGLSERVTALNESFLDYAASTCISNSSGPVPPVVFLDPPWGGPHIWNNRKVDLFLDEIPLSSLLTKILKHNKVFLKAPYNIDKFTYKKNNIELSEIKKYGKVILYEIYNRNKDN